MQGHHCYVVVTSRQEKGIQMSAASLRSYWYEFVRTTTRASQLQSLCGTVLLSPAPRGRGKGHRSGMKVSLHPVTPIPLQWCTKGERAKATMQRCLCLFGWGRVSSKLGTLAAASCTAYQNLLRG